MNTGIITILTRLGGWDIEWHEYVDIKKAVVISEAVDKFSLPVQD